MPRGRKTPGTGRGRSAAKTPAPTSRSRRIGRKAEASLLVTVVTSNEALQDVVTTLLDLDLGGTVVDCKGLLAVLRDEMPIFGGLAAMLPERATGSRVVFSLTTRALARRALDELRATASGGIVGFAIDVNTAAGMGAHNRK